MTDCPWHLSSSKSVIPQTRWDCFAFSQKNARKQGLERRSGFVFQAARDPVFHPPNGRRVPGQGSFPGSPSRAGKWGRQAPRSGADPLVFAATAEPPALCVFQAFDRRIRRLISAGKPTGFASGVWHSAGSFRPAQGVPHGEEGSVGRGQNDKIPGIRRTPGGQSVPWLGIPGRNTATMSSAGTTKSWLSDSKSTGMAFLG